MCIFLEIDRAFEFNFLKTTRRDRVRVFAKFEIPRRVQGPSWNQKKRLGLDPRLDPSIPRFSNSIGCNHPHVCLRRYKHKHSDPWSMAFPLTLLWLSVYNISYFFILFHKTGANSFSPGLVARRLVQLQFASVTQTSIRVPVFREKNVRFM